ncbi:MAG: methyltransferase domain-containing protein [Planctomycetia bacterium]|nr:methyltransferase domain-containing protein [Planctomycetia bacterium]
MKFVKSERYDKDFVSANLMGPNSMKMLEELTASLDLRAGMRVLDLGCGKGLTSIFLAKEFGVQVYATDLWITATENYERFKKMELDSLIIPIHADALDMPFAHEYFDAIISVDAYYYFGLDESVMDAKIAPFVKSGGLIALAFPGFKKDIHENLPPEFLLSWHAEDLDTFHDCSWWSRNFAKSHTIEVERISEMSCCEICWQDWLDSDIDYAINDRKSMNAGAGKYMNLISVIAHKK